MTYELAKNIADLLRFGSYDGKWEVINNKSVQIKDVNSNTYVEMIVSHYESHYSLVEEKKFGKSTSVRKEIPKKEYEIYVETGTLNPGKRLTTAYYHHIKGESDDYQFWDELYTWIKSKWEDKVYKHKCLIEDVFAL